jgi:two-component system, LytTR family, sensor kinase
MKKLLKNTQIWYQNNRTEARFLLYFWVFYILYNMIWYYSQVQVLRDLLRIILNYPIFGLLVFIPSYIILRQYTFQKKFIISIILIILTFANFVAFRYLLNYFVFPALQVNTPYTGKAFDLVSFSFGSMSVFLQNFVLALGYAIAKHSIGLEKRQRKLTEINARLQHERDMAEMAFLQAQINPHFLYNTLNFIYSEAIMVSETVSESVITLSNIMRYTLTEAGSDKLVSLRSEINHIKNYMKLQQMRFSNELCVEMSIEGDENIDALEMLPLVLISFVENIFKHGDIHSAEHPAIIKFEIGENDFSLFIYNLKNKGPKEQSSGVGMKNILTRMDILYPKKYNVEMLINTEDEFSLNFTISDMEEGLRNLKKYKLLSK